MENLKIEYIKIDKITPYEKNARKHEEADINAIKESIQNFGMLDPIGVWSDKNIIVEGHGRLEACKQLDMKEVPCIRLDRLTDEQRKAYALAHNKTAELSMWDFEKLEEELRELQDLGIDMTGFGFENYEDIDIDDFFTEAGEEKEKKKKTITCPHCGSLIEI